MNENIATGAVTISDGRGNTVTVTGVGVMVQWPSLSGRGWKSSEASIDGWLSGELVGVFSAPAPRWTRMKPRTPAEFHQLRRILGLPPRRLILSRRGRR